MNAESLRRRIESWEVGAGSPDTEEVRDGVSQLLDSLESGAVRAANPGTDGWKVAPWVKTGLLWGFRKSVVEQYPDAGPFSFTDKGLFPPRRIRVGQGVRLVPGGSAVRRGAHVGEGVVLMPPAYVNVGAYVGNDTMIDSHALVGSCAQVGSRVHLSAGAQIGGVLEPPGAMPVIVEDGAFVGALAAVLEGVRVGAGAVLAAGLVLTASTPLYDLENRRVLMRGVDGVLAVPERSVVIPGTRPASGAWAVEHGIQFAAAVIVKTRDANTDARAALEEALR